MRQVEGTKFYALVEDICEQSVNFGMDVLNPLSDSKFESLGTLNLKEEDVKSWFKNMGILALTLHKLCWKSNKYPLGTCDFFTVNGGSIPDKLVPNPNKASLSKRDIRAFGDIHHQIRMYTEELRKKLVHFEKKKEYSIAHQHLTRFAIEAMEIPHRIEAVCRGQFYHFEREWSK